MNWYNKTRERVVDTCDTDATEGISEERAREKLATDGPNKLDEKPPTPLWKRFWHQLKDFMILVLVTAALISFVLGERVDAVIILAIVIINAMLGVFQEERAEQALAALKKLSSPHAKVIRGGRQRTIPVEELVRGDLVVLEAGDYIPADIRLVEEMDLQVEESSLTGESMPVDKDCAPIEGDVALGDRINMAFMGSVATYGRGRGIVVATGMATQMGAIAELIAQTEDEPTPLQEKLAGLGKVLAIVALAICVAIFVTGILRGHAVFEMFMTSIALAVAAIPEGLPSIVTITLALGMQRMVKKKSIMRKLPAVETLGSTTVICSDKTGTLTMNQMTMQRLFVDGRDVDLLDGPPEDDAVRLLMETGVLCNDTNVEFEGEKLVTTGDPTEEAYVHLAHATGLDVEQIRAQRPRVDEIPFDSERKMMTTVHEDHTGHLSVTKGAPDEILERVDRIWRDGEIRPITEADRVALMEQNEAYSSRALRVLAVAIKPLDKKPDLRQREHLEQGMVFLGLTGMMDPPREEAKKAIAQCKRAGVQSVMITGDHGVTAMAVARALGLADAEDQAVTGAMLSAMSDEELERNVSRYRVYARVSPEHKVRIVKAWKKRGEIVAMTGDGVNDAPALKNADIGVAMGITGTEVAKGASDMIISDDNFATIVAAVREGRRIYSNILKAVQFLLGCNIGEIVVIFAAILIGLPTPLRPIHILWVNLVTDSFIALALGFEAEEPDIMEVAPREPDASIFADGLGWRVVYQGAMIGMLTLAAFYWGYGVDVAAGRSDALMGQTMAFMTLAFSQLFHAFNLKSPHASLLRTGIGNNKMLIGAFFLSGMLQLGVIAIAPLRSLFEIALLDRSLLMHLGLLIVAPVFIVEAQKAVTRFAQRKGGTS